MLATVPRVRLSHLPAAHSCQVAQGRSFFLSGRTRSPDGVIGRFHIRIPASHDTTPRIPGHTAPEGRGRGARERSNVG